jgi:dTDP-glucose 4,6-dehydratase
MCSNNIGLAQLIKKDVESLFITGGTGFFGRSLLRFIEKLFIESNLKPPSTTVMTRSSSAFLNRYPEFSDLEWLSFYDGNIMSGSDSFPNDRVFSHVIHAAAESIPSAEQTQLDRYNENTIGTRNVLDFAVKNGIKRLLFTSSGGVYGPQPEGIKSFPESYLGIPDPLKIESAYGISKREAEHLCVLYSDKYEIETVIARCFAFVGPDLALDAHFAIGNFIDDVLHERDIRVKGDGSALRTYMYQEDLAVWLLRLLLEGKSQQAYNVGSDEVVSISELALKVANTLCSTNEVRIEGLLNVDNNDRNRYIPSINKAKNELGLKIYTTLEDSIRLTAGLLKENRERCA